MGHSLWTELETEGGRVRGLEDLHREGEDLVDAHADTRIEGPSKLKGVLREVEEV